MWKKTVSLFPNYFGMSITVWSRCSDFGNNVHPSHWGVLIFEASSIDLKNLGEYTGTTLFVSVRIAAHGMYTIRDIFYFVFCILVFPDRMRKTQTRMKWGHTWGINLYKPNFFFSSVHSGIALKKKEKRKKPMHLDTENTRTEQD